MQNDLPQMIDSDRWLLNNGLVSDAIKNNLFFCGSIVHKDVSAVEVKIVAEKKLVEYTIYVPAHLLKKINKYHQLHGSQSLLDMWQFRRLLKKEGCLDFQKVLNSFVTDYCGPKWTVTATVLSFDEYVEGIETENEGSGDGEGDSKPNAG